MKTLKEMLRHADMNQYAVPSFNYSDIWDFIAITEAAKELEAPIMIASNPLVVKQIGVELCSGIGNAAMKKANYSLIHHLDHSFSVEMCKACIDYGYPSVMMDASKYELDENIKLVCDVVDYAHPKGVHVEAELGKIRGKGIEGDFAGGDFLVCVDEAIRFVHETGVDSLAIGIGTAHGFYEGEPEINFKRLDEVNNAIETPLVLHGGSGIPEKDIHKAISLGINKINVGTIIHCTYMNAMKRELNRLGENPYTLEVVKPVILEIKQVVMDWIRVCKADGKD